MLGSHFRFTYYRKPAAPNNEHMDITPMEYLLMHLLQITLHQNVYSIINKAGVQSSIGWF